MTHVLLFDETPFDLRAARAEEGEVVELAYHHPLTSQPLRGALYQAKVTDLDTRLGAAYLTLGESPGFLRRKGKLPQIGKTLLVEIKREPFGGKGAEVTDKPVLRLPLITQPIGHSPRPGPIAAEEEALDEEALPTIDPPKGLGALGATPPEAVLLARLADGGVDEVHVTSPDLRGRLMAILGDAVPVTVVDPAPLRRALDEAEGLALDRTISLSGGGRIIIDETEALVAVDMDLGRQAGQSQKGAADRLLGEALSALGAHARLAALGGQIVVDVPRAAIAAPKIIRDRLTRCFRPLGRGSVPAVTPEGVCVVIAPRPGPSVLERLTEEGRGGIRPARCWRAPVAAARAYRAVSEALATNRTTTMTLALSRRVGDLWEKAKATEALTQAFGARLQVAPDGAQWASEEEYRLDQA